MTPVRFPRMRYFTFTVTIGPIGFNYPGERAYARKIKAAVAPLVGLVPHTRSKAVVVKVEEVSGEVSGL